MLDANLEKIFKRNECLSLSEINKKESVYIKVSELSGHIDLALFTQNALNLLISSYDRGELISDDNKNSIDLDATGAGEFHHWILCDKHIGRFVRSITLRNENQVYHIGAGDYFGIWEDGLREMVEQAKRDARKRNVESYFQNKLFAPFKNSLALMRTSLKNIDEHNAKNDAIYSQIRDLREQIRNNNNAIDSQREQIKNVLTGIAFKNISQKNELPLCDISEVKPESVRVLQDRGSDQEHYGYFLSEKAKQEMIERNKRWFGKEH